MAPDSSASPTAAPPPHGTFAPGALPAAILRITPRLPESWLGRRLAFGLRRLALPFLGAPVDWQAYGLKLRLQPRGNVCEKRVLFTPQYFDPEERAALAQWDGPREAFLDLGANVGLYALIAAALDPPFDKILAVEPQGEIFRRLEDNIALNGFSRVRALRCAISDQSGTAELLIDPDNRGESRLAGAGDGTPAGRERVPCHTLLEILDAQGIDCPEVVKLDVEGMEARILSQHFAAAPPARWPRLLILEYAPARWERDCLVLCAERGYRQARRTRMNVILERR